MRAIRTDVVRTDRTFEFYAASNNASSANIEALFNILVTFAVSHPSIPYCQGLMRNLSIDECVFIFCLQE